ncbi:MAG: sugar ABC transporter permease [Spirochaetales bacterium]|nr:sugar ABC transporter permease [Spirochaetales bacterium]
MKTVLKKKVNNLIIYILMLTPGLLCYLAVIAFPVVFSFVLGFTHYDLFHPEDTKFVGLGNYFTMFADPLFWRALSNNVFVILVSVFGQIPLGTIMAYILFRKMVRFRGFFQSMVFLPITISTIVVGILWKHIFSPHGLGAFLLKQLTHNPDAMFTFAVEPQTAMLPIGFVLIWLYTGFYMLVILANLQKLGDEIIEAAQIDGATEFQIFLRIIVPNLSGVIKVLSILAIAGSLKGFDLIWAMTGGGPANYTMVLPIYMYKYAFYTHHTDAYSFGSAIATFIVAVCIAIIVVVEFIGKTVKLPRRAGGKLK